MRTKDLSKNETHSHKMPYQINSFIIDKKISSGYHSEIYTATDIETDLKVAIKAINKKQHSQNLSEFRLINNEISVLKLVKHKNIVQLFEFFESSDFIFIVTEYCPGIPLSEYVWTTQLNEDDMRAIFIQLIDLLNYLHKINVTHRDIQPNNIIVNEVDKSLKLVDFGNSAFYPNDLQNEVLGNPWYACPEMHYGQYYNCEKADVWSCGVVLYLLVSRTLPFNQEESIINNINLFILEFSRVTNYRVSQELVDWLRNMWNVDMDKRYKFVEILQHSWLKKGKTKGHQENGWDITQVKFPFDHRIAEICKYMGYKSEGWLLDLQNNLFYRTTSVYKQCVLKCKNYGFTSVSDIGSDAFHEYMNNHFNYLGDETSRWKKDEYLMKENDRIEELKAIEDQLFENVNNVIKQLDYFNENYKKIVVEYISSKEEAQEPVKKTRVQSTPKSRTNKLSYHKWRPRKTKDNVVQYRDNLNAVTNVMQIWDSNPYGRKRISKYVAKQWESINKNLIPRRNADVKKASIKHAVLKYSQSINIKTTNFGNLQQHTWSSDTETISNYTITFENTDDIDIDGNDDEDGEVKFKEDEDEKEEEQEQEEEEEEEEEEEYIEDPFTAEQYKKIANDLQRGSLDEINTLSQMPLSDINNFSPKKKRKSINNDTAKIPVGETLKVMQMKIKEEIQERMEQIIKERKSNKSSLFTSDNRSNVNTTQSTNTIIKEGKWIDINREIQYKTLEIQLKSVQKEREDIERKLKSITEKENTLKEKIKRFYENQFITNNNDYELF